MRRTLFKSKIHRATVTQADLDYEGSVTIDAALMRAADFLPYEKVHIWNRTNGARLETYALEGPEGSGTICVNGAAAHLARPGDIVIIATFAEVESEDEARAWKPTVVHVDAQNRIVPIARRDPRAPTSAEAGLGPTLSRAEALRAFIATHPNDPFPRYALALEYKNGNRFEEARQEFAVLMRDHADYVATYLHAGNTHLALGDRAAARETFTRGNRGQRPQGRRPRPRRARIGAGDSHRIGASLVYRPLRLRDAEPRLAPPERRFRRIPFMPAARLLAFAREARLRRALALRFWAASERREAAVCPSRLRARVVARFRRADGARGLRRPCPVS